MRPPIAKTVPYSRTVHGDTTVDPYFWLRDRSDPNTMAYLEAENKYTETMMQPTGRLQEELYQEILGRIVEDDLSVPVKRDTFYYYVRTEQGKAYPIYCRKQGSVNAPEAILLDGNLLAAGQKYLRIGNYAPSQDHRLLAYSIDLEGDENFTTYVKDLETGALLPDRVQRSYYSLEWANDNRTFFYTKLDEAMRPFQVWRHELGDIDDTLVFQEDDARFSVSLIRSHSDQYLFIDSSSSVTGESLYIHADRPRDKFTVLLARRHEVEYDAYHHGDHFYIRTNEGAKNFRLMRTLLTAPSKETWEEVIPGRADTLIEGLEPFESHMAIYERQRGLTQICVRNMSDGSAYYLDFPEPVYSVGGTGNAEFHTRILRFAYTSLIASHSVFDFDMETRQRELKKQYEVRGGYDPSKYRSERVFAKAPDGVEVPISLVYAAGMKPDGSSPLLLYGYGSYGASIDPSFNSDRFSLIDRGFVYAIAHIRGGEDLGKAWHDDGKLTRKTNSFTDFIACAEHLIAAGYTAKQRLAAIGGSAGGLLMGAVVNLRPDLFRSVVAKVPFVDNLNTGLDPTLPLTIAEYEEWGNPVDDPAAYAYIKSYSPYENVARHPYPAMLVSGGLNDPRVSYWEPAKWVAKLRARKTNDQILLLKTDLGSGHFGPSGRYAHIREVAFDYAFLLTYR